MTKESIVFVVFVYLFFLKIHKKVEIVYILNSPLILTYISGVNNPNQYRLIPVIHSSEGANYVYLTASNYCYHEPGIGVQ